MIDETSRLSSSAAHGKIINKIIIYKRIKMFIMLLDASAHSSGFAASNVLPKVSPVAHGKLISYIIIYKSIKTSIFKDPLFNQMDICRRPPE